MIAVAAISRNNRSKGTAHAEPEARFASIHA